MTVRHPARLALVALLLGSTVIASIACSGGGGGGGPTTIPTSPTPECTPITDTSLTHLQAAIFTPNCALASCHASGAPNPTDQPLDLSSAAATYSHTVEVRSAPSELYNGATQLYIVDTSGHAASYLYKKIVNDPGISGTPMPNGQPLCQQKIDAIAAWIDAGAPNN